MLKVTKVKIFPANSDKAEKDLLAFCAVELENQLMITGMRLYYGGFVRFPSFSIKSKNDIYYTTNRDFFNELRDCILEGYLKYIETGEKIHIPKELN